MVYENVQSLQKCYVKAGFRSTPLLHNYENKKPPSLYITLRMNTLYFSSGQHFQSVVLFYWNIPNKTKCHNVALWNRLHFFANKPIYIDVIISKRSYCKQYAYNESASIIHSKMQEISGYTVQSFSMWT